MIRTWTVAAAILTLGAASLRAQGVELCSKPTVLSGCASNCTKPATVAYKEVRDATPEWQEIESEGVRRGSARFTLLSARMRQRILAAVGLVAINSGHDLVVTRGDIEDARGLEVEDITDLVIDELESVALTP